MSSVLDQSNVPYISVIVCIYNGQKVLLAAIESLLNQQYSKDKYEIIFIDDGSSDNSRLICEEILEKNKGTRLAITYGFKKNSGLSCARNTGIFYAKGKIVAFMDQDAVADKHWLSEIEKSFNGDKDVGVVGGKVELLNGKSWFATFIHWIHYYMEDKKGKEIIPVIGTNMAFKKEVFEKVGGFFEEFKLMGDESSFIAIKVLPFFNKNEAEQAVVYHERPALFRPWFRERFFNGHEYALVHYISRCYNKSDIKCGVYITFRLICFMFPLLLLSGVFFKLPLIMFVGLFSLACFIYRSFWRDNIFIKARILRRECGLLYFIFLFPLAIVVIGLGKMNEDYGFFRGLLKYRNTQVSDKISDEKLKYFQSNIEKGL